MKNSKERVLILGGNSYVGYALFEEIRSSRFAIPATRRNIATIETSIVFDMLNISKIVEILILYKITVVVNCIAISRLDYAETHKDESLQVSYDFLKKLVEVCNEYNQLLVHFSSSMVYRGGDTKFNETSEFDPLNHYGNTKALADMYIRETSEKYAIIRPSAILTQSKSFQKKILIERLLKMAESQCVGLVNDAVTNFVAMGDLIKVIRRIILGGLTGEFNLGGDTVCSYYDIGILTKKNNQKLCILDKSIDSFNLTATRPKILVLDNKKVVDKLLIKPTPIEDVVFEMYR